MTVTTHQTVRICRGKHGSPDDGACVMELASMLSGGPFTDRPASACPVIGAVLRGYNDIVGDDARQDLVRYASEVVGTRADEVTEAGRLEHCFEAFDAFDEEQRHTLRRRLMPMTARDVRRLRARAHLPRHRDEFGRALARYFQRSGARGHARFVELIDELIALRGCAPTSADDAGHEAVPSACVG